MSEDFYLRYYVGHKGKFGHEFLEFEFRPDGKLRYANNSNYKNDTMIRKEAYVHKSVMDELRRVIEDSEIMEGAMIRGPFALCENATIKMGAKIYGATTIGPYSKVGGEVNNCVIFGYSNKGHDGFLGNSVLGEWCNIGADTNNSNLKNNYAEVRLWDYETEGFAKTGLQFCGL